ncbi:hypothetical protein AVEN_137527-1 [Araneus ventricosus]|uniref:Uncharacterized protein n=1 Tax=Araneus ventricosus TaxID=182803 RepID=A0A4Y2JN08_ARAVE|nr:hypothetical protein AVEN_137527-1 [Araneus ventricosus]
MVEYYPLHGDRKPSQPSVFKGKLAGQPGVRGVFAALTRYFQVAAEWSTGIISFWGIPATGMPRFRRRHDRRGRKCSEHDRATGDRL